MPCGFCISLVTYGLDAGGNTDSSVMTGGDAKSLLQMTAAGWAREEWGHQRKAKAATAGAGPPEEGEGGHGWGRGLFKMSRGMDRGISLCRHLFAEGHLCAGLGASAMDRKDAQCDLVGVDNRQR